MVMTSSVLSLAHVLCDRLVAVVADLYGAAGVPQLWLESTRAAFPWTVTLRLRVLFLANGKEGEWTDG